jgi:hypothetical protein
MRLIISKTQLKRIIAEQSTPTLTPSNQSFNLQPTTNVASGTINPTNGPSQGNIHDFMAALAIGTAFIPVAGIFISAAIGMADAALYYNEGDKKTAGLVGVLSMLPFVGKIVTKIPGIKELGVKGMAALAGKLGTGAKNLTKAEAEIARAISNNSVEIQNELTKLAPKLKNIVNEVIASKAPYVQKYGERAYNDLLKKYLYGGIEKESFINTLKNVKNPNIKIKPVLGGGADHRVFQSAIHPNQIIKAEIRSGEVNKWYDTFRKFPNIFAKVIKKVKVKGTNGEIMDAVVLEKLDTKPFETFWSDMEKTLFKMEKQTPGSPMLGVEYTLKHIKEPFYKNLWNNFTNYVKQNNGQISGKVDELNKLIDELYKITPKPDIRKFNFGYDKTGVLKALDL